MGEMAEASDLGAVLIESCPARWATAQEEQTLPGDMDEMQVAAELAAASACGLALADQSIEVTSGRLAQLCKQTVVDLLSPWRGGWHFIRDDIANGLAALKPDGDGDGLSVSAFVDVAYLQGAPSALRRWLSSNPEVIALLAAATVTLAAALSVGGGDPIYPWELTSRADAASELLPSVCVALVESVLLMRVLLVGLVEERNYVMARHIRAASMQVLTPPRAVRQRGRGKDGRAVVAVLGLAHLNGVRRLLTTSRAV